MAFPTGTGAQKSLSLTLGDILAKSSAIKQTALDAKARLASQGMSGAEVFALLISLITAKQYLAARAMRPGLEAFTREVFADSGLDITAEYTAMIAAIDAVIALIDTQTPSQLAAATYSPAATVAFRSQLQALADSID